MLKHLRVARTSIKKKQLFLGQKNNFSWDKKECSLYKKRPGQGADQNKNIICHQDHTKIL